MLLNQATSHSPTARTPRPCLLTKEYIASMLYEGTAGVLSVGAATLE